MMAHNVTIKAVNQPAAVVFRSIVEQTGKNFVYSSELLKNMRVTVNVKSKPLRQTLSILFKDSDIDWEIKGNNIILKRRLRPQKPVRVDKAPEKSAISVADSQRIPRMLE
ncbi:MAG: STN domain-containing protein, partial [Muribaculaceae bacterium]|nr:STN domain-containing protein [Muribaculaceae bacterium]